MNTQAVDLSTPDTDSVKPTGRRPFGDDFWGQFRSPLCWRITALVFAAIVAIEVLILVPSVANERAALMAEREATALAAARAALTLTPADATNAARIAALDVVAKGTPLVGGTVFDADGRWLGEFGETALPAAAGVDDRHAVRWDASQLGQPLRLVVRLDIGDIGSGLWDYVVDIAALVGVIAAFVTAVTMYGLGRMLLRPLLELRCNLLALTGATRDAKPNYMFSRRGDEWGDVVDAYNHLLDHLRARAAVEPKK